MKSLKLITLLMSTTIALSACSSGDDIILGSRDDIIIMKNGVPVSGGAKAEATMSAPTVDMMKPVVDVPVIEKTAQDAVIEVQDDVVAVAEDIAEKQVEEAVTEIVMDKVVEPEINAVVETVSETIEPAVETVPVMASIPMKAAKSVNTELMQEAVSGAVPEVSAPMGTVTMKTGIVSEVENTPVEEPVSAPVEEAKVEGGCYRKVLIPTVLDENNRVVKTPYVDNRRVLCEEKMTSGLVAVVQQALINREYVLGSADGKLGNKTQSAIEMYQRKNGLGIGGFSYETLESLGIKVE
jgi:hypothetical protein